MKQKGRPRPIKESKECDKERGELRPLKKREHDSSTIFSCEEEPGKSTSHPSKELRIHRNQASKQTVAVQDFEGGASHSDIRRQTTDQKVENAGYHFFIKAAWKAR